jgi:hypothetical protein
MNINPPAPFHENSPPFTPYFTPYFTQVKSHLVEAAGVVKDVVVANKQLQWKVENPQPPCDFGEKGQKWSYQVCPPPPPPFSPFLFYAPSL